MRVFQDDLLVHPFAKKISNKGMCFNMLIVRESVGVHAGSCGGASGTRTVVREPSRQVFSSAATGGPLIFAAGSCTGGCDVCWSQSVPKTQSGSLEFERHCWLSCLHILFSRPSQPAVLHSWWFESTRLLGARTLLGAPGIATRSKDATRGSWHRY